MRDRRLYTLDAVDLAVFESLWTAPRPLLGRKIGYRAGSGFAVYAVHVGHIDDAARNAADPIERRDIAWQAERLAELEYVEGYRELIADGTMLAEAADLIEIPLDLAP